MGTSSRPSAPMRRFARWVAKPPQAYAAYFVALIMVAVLSFYVGAHLPKKRLGIGPAHVAIPRD